MCDPPRIYHSQNTPSPLYTSIYGSPRIRPSFPEYNPLLNIYVQPVPPRIYPPPPPPVSITICDLPRTYHSLPKYTPFSTYNYMRPSQNLPHPPRIYPPPLFHHYIQCSQNLPLPLRIYTLFHYYIQRSQNLPLPPRICPILNMYVQASQIMWATIIYPGVYLRIYPGLISGGARNLPGFNLGGGG